MHNGRLEAITSYYIQRPLRRRESEIGTVAALSRRLAETARPPYEWDAGTSEQPRVRKHLPELDGKTCSTEQPDPDLRQATIDFAATKSGIRLLEGGPPPWAGGHPCCFAGGSVRARGVLLESREQPEPLPGSLNG